ncbi:MAG TPA: SRPBCC domain-containing protein [bacterium]|nr:SRPBCC domain-containing protein [bacterium]
MGKIELEAYYPYSIENVWEALTRPEALEQWLMKNEGFEPVQGKKFNFYAKPVMGWDGKARCEVLEVEKPHRIVWSQCGNDEGKDPFIMTWTLKQEGPGTRLTLLHEGIPNSLKGILIKKMMGKGWKGMFEKRIPLVLQYAAQKGWGQFPRDRRLAETDCHA